MSESQSRFSIIDELIEKKTDTQEKILEAEMIVSNKEKELAKWERDVTATRETYKVDLENVNKEQNLKVKMLGEQLVEYEKGIEAVKSISSVEAK